MRPAYIQLAFYHSFEKRTKSQFLSKGTLIYYDEIHSDEEVSSQDAILFIHFKWHVVNTYYKYCNSHLY